MMTNWQQVYAAFRSSGLNKTTFYRTRLHEFFEAGADLPKISVLYEQFNLIEKYMVSSLFARVEQIFQGASPQALHLERLFPIFAAQSRAPLLRDKVKTLLGPRLVIPLSVLLPPSTVLFGIVMKQ